MMDQPPQNKMMTAPPAKKEYHFAATAEHYAEVVYAETLAEAEQLYQKVKRLLPLPGPATGPDARPLSTAAPAPEEEGVE